MFSAKTTSHPFRLNITRERTDAKSSLTSTHVFSVALILEYRFLDNLLLEPGLTQLLDEKGLFCDKYIFAFRVLLAHLLWWQTLTSLPNPNRVKKVSEHVALDCVHSCLVLESIIQFSSRNSNPLIISFSFLLKV